MKLLSDQNLFRHLCDLLSDCFPSAAHVRDFNLQDADDLTIWEFARTHDFTIVSKDSDFHQRSFVYGHPPKVVWLKLGNVSTFAIEGTLREHALNLTDFHREEAASFLIIG